MIVLGVLTVIVMVVFFIFVFVVLFGAPYVPTLKKGRQIALDLLDLKPGQTLYELGSGDGSLLLEAAVRGINSVGYELNPILVIISRWRTRKYKHQVRVVWGNFWKANFADADSIFIFQMDKSMKKLEAKIKREREGKPIKIASHAFKIPDKKPSAKRGAILLYEF